jgi:hypothetical protein
MIRPLASLMTLYVPTAAQEPFAGQLTPLRSPDPALDGSGTSSGVHVLPERISINAGRSTAASLAW